jgi:hypothetical protein
MKQDIAVDPPTAGVSIIICSLDRFEEPAVLLERYAQALAALKRPIEIIYAVDRGSDLAARLTALDRSDLMVLQLPRQFGEAGKIREALHHARFEAVLLLPPFMQVAAEALPDLVRRLETSDVVIAERDRSQEAFLNRARGYAFSRVARANGSNLRDPGCRARAFRREVLETVPLQENQIRFLAIMAEHYGYKVESVLVPQASEDRAYRSHGIGQYVDTVLDTLSVAFLVRFLQKPFRLFGGLGLILTMCGVLVGIVLLIERWMGVPLSDRPLLLLSLLLVVLGIQVIAVGLIAEIVLFTRLPRQSTYRIRRIHERLPVETAQRASAAIVDA